MQSLIWLFILCICIASSLPIRDHQYVQDAKEFAIGFGEGGRDTVTSVIKVASHPKAALKGAGYAIKHPKKVVGYMADQTRDSFQNNGARAAGKAAFYAVTIVTPAFDVLEAGTALSDLVRFF